MNTAARESLNRAASRLEREAATRDPLIGTIFGSIASSYRAVADRKSDEEVAREDHNDELSRLLLDAVLPYASDEVKREESRNGYLRDEIRRVLEANNTLASMTGADGFNLPT